MNYQKTSIVNFKTKLSPLWPIFFVTDESTDVSDVAQFAGFIRGVDECMQVTKEFVEHVSMKETTNSDDVFVSLVGALDKMVLTGSKL